MAFHRLKKNKLWAVKAVDRSTRGTVAWVLGNRGSATFRRLCEKAGHLKGCTFYTGGWRAFSDVLPLGQLATGKEHTVAIERGNSSARQRLARFARRAVTATDGFFREHRRRKAASAIVHCSL